MVIFKYSFLTVWRIRIITIYFCLLQFREMSSAGVYRPQIFETTNIIIQCSKHTEWIFSKDRYSKILKHFSLLKHFCGFGFLFHLFLFLKSFNIIFDETSKINPMIKISCCNSSIIWCVICAVRNNRNVRLCVYEIHLIIEKISIKMLQWKTSVIWCKNSCKSKPVYYEVN